MEITYSEKVKKLFHPKVREDMGRIAMLHRGLMECENGEMPNMVYITLTPNITVKAEYSYLSGADNQTLDLGSIYYYVDYLN